MIFTRRIFFLWVFFCSLAATAEPPTAAIASGHPLATAAGQDILAQGGNAFDAAIATAAALAVVEPGSSGLGGGGFWLLHRASDGFEVMVDARERAPLAATANMYLDATGQVIPNLSRTGALAAAIPGTPAALVHMAQKYGRLPLARSLAPAIRLAKEGFPVSRGYRKLAQARIAALSASPEAARIFLHDGAVPELGYVVRQPELAKTFTRLVAQGQDGFYTGTTARHLVTGVAAAGGIWSLRDLSDYRVIERAPLHANFGKIRVTTANLPSGGVVFLEALAILQNYSLTQMEPERRDHVLIETLRLAYRDRAHYLGDPDFVNVDVNRLLSPSYIRNLRREILHRATPSEAQGESPQAPAGTNTTHFSIIDREGSRVAATLTINSAFGSGFMPRGTGVLLNNEMDDFAAKPGAPNLYGLVGSAPNAIAPGKRPLSSMTPTFLEDSERVAVLGTPGGSRIISMVLLATLDFARGRGTAADWVKRPRFHHQYLPDVVEYEAGAFTEAELRKLQQWGHRLKRLDNKYGNMQIAVFYKKTGRLEAASDPRGEGEAQVK